MGMEALLREAYTPGAWPLQEMRGAVVPLLNFGRSEKMVAVPEWLGARDNKRGHTVHP